MDLTEEFAEHRGHLRAVAYRMLGSAADADDALQEAWLRLARAERADIHNARAWLTTVVARVCLDILRTRTARREVPLEAPPADVAGPEQEAALADSVGLALLVVLDTLTPAERLAFVLHDLFALPFAEIAPILDRSVAATKMLASRARRRVRTAATPSPDLARQYRVVDAFLAASRNGDFAALVELLDPDVVARADGGAGGPIEVHGAEVVGRQALSFSHRAATARIELVDGAYAIVAARLVLRIRVGASDRIESIDIGPVA